METPTRTALIRSKLQESKRTKCLSLNSIHINSNDLSVLEKALKNINSIQHIYMSGCHLTESALNRIYGHFGQIIKLDLSGNSLQEIGSEVFEHLASVETLDLRMNKLSTIGPEICVLERLTELNLAQNQLLRLPEEIGRLKKLKVLGVSNKLLDEIPGNIFKGKIQHSLKVLNCGGNVLNSLPEELGLVTQLEELDIRDNNLVHLPPSVKSLTRLQVFHFSGNRWNVIGLQHSLTRQDVPLESSYGPNALERLYSFIRKDYNSTS